MSTRDGHAALKPFEPRFARAQTEWALWVCIRADRKRKPSSTFKVSIKHLLEFDRAEPASRGAPNAGMAFSDHRSEGAGDHAFFSVYDAVLLSVALRLLDLGFKRKEVVLMLREQRERLRRPIGRIIKDYSAYAGSGEPLYEQHDPLEPKNRVVLVIPRVDLAAEYIDDDAEGVQVCVGMPALLDVIERMLVEKLVLVDVGLAAYMLPSLLLQAPASQRTRRPKRA